MPIAWVAVLACALLWLAYWVYGRRVGGWLKLDDSKPTPAVELNDGNDFVPTSRPILLAQHFASIAAAGPIVGPIAAGIAYGWAPTLGWILFGCIFIGACHDMSSLVASVKHGAKSLPEIAKVYMGPSAYRLSLGFVWLCLIYVLIAFTDVTAQQFVAREEWGGVLHDIGGGVATSSILYLLLSVAMGVALTRFRVPLWLATAVFLPLLLAIILLGQRYPLVMPGSHPTILWGLFILAYCALASLLPLWLLLQPRGYLGGFFLYAVLALGILGLFWGGFTVDYPAYRGFFNGAGEPLYPFLFITVACGACSGFHGLVCSGTTSKQLSRQAHAPLIGYGGMLLEGVVAVLALATVMMWAPGTPLLSKSPSEIYATGLAHFANRLLGVDLGWGTAFGMLAFATFVYDTLDCATRLGRYLMEELLPWRGWKAKLTATGLTLGLPLLYVLLSPSVTRGGKSVPLWLGIWPIFGSSNQLLAALTLFLLAVWQARSGAFWRWLLVPALIMFVTTALALLHQFRGAVLGALAGGGTLPILNALITLALLGVSVGFGYLCVVRLREALRRPRTATA